jgi:hypothetical protein
MKYNGEAIANATDVPSNFHALSGSWTLWSHLPHDTDWSLNSYTKICQFNTVEEAVAVTEMLPPKLIVNCMLFLMRTGISPIWEDVRNRNGGCFSYKISNKIVHETWKFLTYILLGETISKNQSFVSSVTGITISPKKNFCIIKIWLSNCSYQNPEIITNEIKGIVNHGFANDSHQFMQNNGIRMSYAVKCTYL